MTTDKSPPVLLPCPFCGDNNVGNYELPGEHDVFRRVVCDTCGASCSDEDTLPQKNAYEAWNTRVKVIVYPCHQLQQTIEAKNEKI